MQRIEPTPGTLRDDDDAFPSLAAMAGRNAYRGALRAGQTVMIAEEGILYEVSPDGKRRIIRHLQPLIPVQAGRLLKLW